MCTNFTHLTAFPTDMWHSTHIDISDFSIVGTCDILDYQMRHEVI